MRYQVELKSKAEKDLKSISSVHRSSIIERLRWLESGLRGDVKKLTNAIPAYRMRSGDFRVLFEVAQGKIVVYRILHRREAYR